MVILPKAFNYLCFLTIAYSLYKLRPINSKALLSPICFIFFIYNIYRRNRYIPIISYSTTYTTDTENGTYKQYANRVNADMYLYPIPQSQIEVRKGLYTQNKGY